MSERMDFMELLIQALRDHEKKLDELISRLENLIYILERGNKDAKRRQEY